MRVRAAAGIRTKVTPDQLRQRIELGEDSVTEFKDERVQNDAIAAAIVAFANTAGGLLIFGVRDNRSIQGVSDADELIRRIDQVAGNSVEPPFRHLTVEKHLLDGKLVLAVQVPRGPQRPYRTGAGVYYVRGAAGKHPAGRYELLVLMQSAGDYRPDEMPVEDASRADLDRQALLGAFPEMVSFTEEQQLRSLINKRLMASREHPTLGGLLCYGIEPQKFRPYAKITALRHKGVHPTEEYQDRIELGGTVLSQVAGARQFVRVHLAARPRSAIYPYPVEAIDQAIINAVLHRDYLLLSQVRICVYDDRVEVISPGKLLNTVTIETMREGYHVVRNPVLFSQLARHGLATDAGKGVPTMIQLTRAAGLPEPEFSIVGAELRVAFRLDR